VEVGLRNGWIVDIAACGYPYRNTSFRFFGEIQEYSRPRSPQTCVVEVKVSRGDFRRDLKAKFATAGEHMPAHMHFIIAPTKLLSVDEIPAPWGFLEWQEVKGSRRGRIFLRRKPEVLKPDEVRVVRFVHALMCSIDNRTYKAHHHVLNRMFAASDTENRQRLTVDKVSDTILRLLEGKEPSYNLSERVMKNIESSISYMRDHIIVRPKILERWEDPATASPFPPMWKMVRAAKDA